MSLERENVGCGRGNFGSKYLKIGSDFVKHIYTH
jgi:hypothetical protein